MQYSLRYERIWKWNTNGDTLPLYPWVHVVNQRALSVIFSHNEYLLTRLHPMYESLGTLVRFCFKCLPCWNNASSHFHPCNPSSNFQERQIRTALVIQYFRKGRNKATICINWTKRQRARISLREHRDLWHKIIRKSTYDRYF